jgi:hypothetical protein
MNNKPSNGNGNWYSNAAATNSPRELEELLAEARAAGTAAGTAQEITRWKGIFAAAGDEKRQLAIALASLSPMLTVEEAGNILAIAPAGTPTSGADFEWQVARCARQAGHA